MLKSVVFMITVIVIIALSVLAGFAQGQDVIITAEAIGQANVRGTADINGVKVGEIVSGTVYPALARNEFFNWILLADPNSSQPFGWVFADLLTLRGGTINQLPLSQLDLSAQPTPTVGITPTPPQVPTSADTAGVETTPTVANVTETSTFGVTGTVLGEINVRYGPGVEYDALRRAFQGETFDIVAVHSQVPWVQVRFTESPTGTAWIASDLLDITGSLVSLPVISQLNLNLPTLTPTPALRQAIALPGRTPVPISPAFAALGDRIWNQVLAANFVPEGSRFASLYLEDLQTGEAISFNSDIAYSGTSINKIAVLAEYFRTITGYPNPDEGVDIAKTMICSQNVTTNELLGVIGGDGFPSEDFLGGAERVTQLLRELGLQRTFLTAPYDARPNPSIEPTAPPRPIEVPITVADQDRANPNPSNQVAVDEMGLLLSSIYECAFDESGPLINGFDGAFTPQECRLMLHVMANNTVDAFIKAGVPADIEVSHKHGWIADTHTNAGIVFTPGGDYVMVMALYQPETLLFPDTLPVVANASREVYNYYNPNRPLSEPREGFIPEADDCPYAPAHPLVFELTDPNFLAENDSSLFYNDSLAPVSSTPTPTPTP